MLQRRKRTTLLIVMAAAALAAGSSGATAHASLRPGTRGGDGRQYKNRTFLRSAATGQIYRIAGGAPLLMTNCKHLESCRHALTVSQATIDRLPKLPANGTYLRATDNTIIYVIAGGAPFRITHFGPLKGWKHYVNVNQSAVDSLRPYPISGTFLRSAETGQYYRVAGGSALPISDCRPLAGCAGAVAVDDYAISSFDHLLAIPASGTVVRSIETGRYYRVEQLTLHPAAGPGSSPVGVNQTTIAYLSSFPQDGLFVRSSGRAYRIAGGAPLPITDCPLFAVCAAKAVTVSRKVIDRLPSAPANGVFLRAIETGAIYETAGGAVFRITHFTPIKGWNHYLEVDQATIDGLPTVPVDRTFLRSAETGRYYLLAGGAPLPVSGCRALSGCPHAVTINELAIEQLIARRAFPDDGFYLRAAETGRIYRVSRGIPVPVSKCLPSAGCRDVISVSQLALAGAYLRAAGTGRTYRVAGSALLPIRDCKPLAGCPGTVEIPPALTARLLDRYPIPTQGTFLRAADSGRVYRLAGGAPLPISGCSQLAGCPRSVGVDQSTIDRLLRLRAYPINGTLLRAVETGFYYKVAGGSPFPVTDLEGVDDPANALDVSQNSIDRLRPIPSDGTLLRVAETNVVYRVTGGLPVGISCAPPTGCADAVAVNQRALDRLAQLKSDRLSTSRSKGVLLLLLGLFLAPAFYLVFAKPGRLGARASEAVGRLRLPSFWSSDWNRVLATLLLAAVAFLPTAIVVARSSTRPTLNGNEMASFSRLLLIVYVLAVAILALIGTGDRVPRAIRLLAVLLIAYWLTGALADLDQGNAYKRLSFFLVPLIIAALAALRPRHERALAVLIWTSIVLCAASLLLALFNSASAYTDPARTTSFLFRNRLAGILDHANTLGVVAGLGVVLTFRSKGFTRWLGLPVCAFALFASDSRGAWVATFAALSLLVAASLVSRGDRPGAVRKQLLLAGSITALFICGLAVFLLARGDSHVGSLNDRTSIWHLVLGRWTTSPLIGHGPGVWRTLIDNGIIPYWAGQGHDQFFETLMTTGIIGLLLLLAILFVWTRAAIAATRNGRWLPLALETYVILLGVLLSPLNPWGANSGLWLLALILFLDPGEGGAEETVPSFSLSGMRRPSRAVTGTEPG